MHKRIRQLSGGMRRRVGIAQALIGRPDLLVLDEPTAGLDPAQRLRSRELLGTDAAGSTVVLSTHQTDDVAALCQHVIVLLEGQVRFTATPASLVFGQEAPPQLGPQAAHLNPTVAAAHPAPRRKR